MNRTQCEQLLTTTLKKQPDLASSVSSLTRTAWGNSKAECQQLMGGTTAIYNFAQRAVKNTSSTTNTSTQTFGAARVTQATTSTGGGFFGEIQEGFAFAGTILVSLVWIFLGIIALIFFWKMIRYLLAFIYDVMNAHRILYLKVLVPRGDDKISKENSKEVAKDMKEKIGRISQVYDNIHKLGDVSFYDNVMHRWFHKPKVTFITSYEKGQITFVVGLYPEYQKLVEGAISAQFSEASIEITSKPKFFAKPYTDIAVLEPTKDPVYPIKTFKQMQDDPLNNILDGLGKVNTDDTFHIVIPVKPYIGEGFNTRAKNISTAVYRRDETTLRGTAWWKYLLMPWKVIDFLINGVGKQTANKEGEGGKDMVRMLKAEEESINIMGEEAGRHAFLTSVFLISSSDDPHRPEENINNMIGAFTIFRDEYNNELDENNFHADILGFLFKPLWKFAADFHLTQFFFKRNVFTPNSLASLFHFPDGNFNRSPAIKWMEYKVLSAPDNLPAMTTESGFVMSGVVAEEYKKGSLSDIIEEKYQTHRAAGQKVEMKEILTPLEEVPEAERAGKEIVEQNGKQFVKEVKEEKKWGYKIFKDGVLLGVNIYRNVYTPVYMKRNDRTRHHYIIGKSGGGKSVYIGALARQDIWNGDGVCVIDPHGDLVEDILQYVPKERAKDIIYFDAGNEDRPMGLNLYEIDNIDQADRTVNDATEIFLKMFGPEIFGPRIQEYFKYGSLTLLEDFEDRPTLLDVPRIFTDEHYRELKTKNLKNAVVKNFRERTYASMGDREKQEIIPYFTSKFVSFNTNRLIRNIIGQTKSAFRFREVMDNRKILLISLSKGKIGEINAQLLGMIIVSQIYNAAMSRANIPEKERKDFYLYVDEFQNFVSGTFADILSEARKYRLSLVMAHQYIAQLEPAKGLGGDGGGKGDVKAAVFGNVGTMQSFKVGAPDAEFLEKEYAPVLSAQDIVGIANYKVYIKLNINNSTSRVFSMNTIFTEDYKNPKVASLLKEYSAKKYGRKREFVDAEITARLGLLSEEELAGADVPQVPEGETAPVSPPPVDQSASSAPQTAPTDNAEQQKSL